jgi:hypothetical protein
MNTRNHTLHLAIALITFIFSVGIDSCLRYIQTNTQTYNAISSPPPPEPRSSTSDTEQNVEPESQFDAFGYYYIAGEPPQGFEDINHISVFTADYEVGQNPYSVRAIPRPPTGILWTSQRYRMTRLNIGNGRISFATETARGLSYQFNGRFLVHSSFYGLPEKAIVLEGHITKFRRGRKIAESDIRFTWYEGH